MTTPRRQAAVIAAVKIKASEQKQPKIKVDKKIVTKRNQRPRLTRSLKSEVSERYLNI